MATDLGKVGLRMRGNWNSSATYEVLDAVSYNNGFYIANTAVPAGTAPTNTTYWQSVFAPPIFTTFDWVIAGTAITNGYKQVATTIPYSTYYPVAVIDGANWDEKLTYSLSYSSGVIQLLIRYPAGGSYTIPSNRSNIHILCVNRTFVEAGTLPS